MLLFLLLFLMLGDDPAINLLTLEGEWLCSSLEMSGKSYPKVADENRRLVIEGYVVTQSFGDSEPFTMVISRFNSSCDPATIDLTRVEDVQTIRGILSLEGDILTLCTSSRGERPTDFSSGPDSPNLLSVYSRSKP
jgi:uncharacterized protein (TIGR03067 family)